MFLIPQKAKPVVLTIRTLKSACSFKDFVLMNFTLIKVVQLFGVGSITQSLNVHKITVDIRVVQSTEGHIYRNTQQTEQAW